MLELLINILKADGDVKVVTFYGVGAGVGSPLYVGADTARGYFPHYLVSLLILSWEKVLEREEKRERTMTGTK